MNYEQAKEKAIEWANLTQRETGIEKLGPVHFAPRMLPDKRNRYGSELRCEVVPPQAIAPLATSKARHER